LEVAFAALVAGFVGFTGFSAVSASLGGVDFFSLLAIKQR
jgi:hypothetical protein